MWIWIREPLLLGLPGVCWFWGCLVWQDLGLHLHGRKQRRLRVGKGNLVFKLFQHDRFQTRFRIFFTGHYWFFAWVFFSFSVQFFTFLILLPFLAFYCHPSLICLYPPSISFYPFPVHYKTNRNPRTVAFPWKWNIHCFSLKSLGHCWINSTPRLLRIYLFAVIIQRTSKCLLESSNTQHLPKEH